MRFWLLLLSVVTCSTLCARAQEAALLPDAPQAALNASADAGDDGQSQSSSPTGQNGAPQQVEKLPGKPDPGKASSVSHAPLEKRKWARYADPGERLPVLSADDKLHFWLHEEVKWYSPAPAFISAGFGQLTNGNPKYGTDSGAFGERLGIAFVRQASMRLFTDSLCPWFFREDPRYYRKASGSYGARAAYAAERAVVTRRNSGAWDFNYSDIFGHLAASALTEAYYPAASRSESVVMETWATSIAGAAGNNLFLEFWPDVLDAWHRHQREKREHSSRK